MAAEEGQLRQQNPGMSQDQFAFLGNEACRAATVATVEQLTGVHIDHFAEINLDGFYELAKVLGGVEVCLTHRCPTTPTPARRTSEGRLPAPQTPGRRWRSSASAMACPTVTWTAPTASRRSWNR